LSSEYDLLAFGRQLKYFRRQAKMSQKTLAMSSGVTQPCISQFENGERTPKEETVHCFARALNLDVKDLMRKGALQDVVKKNLGGLTPVELQQVLDFIMFVKYKRSNKEDPSDDPSRAGII